MDLWWKIVAWQRMVSEEWEEASWLFSHTCCFNLCLGVFLHPAWFNLCLVSSRMDCICYTGSSSWGHLVSCQSVEFKVISCILGWLQDTRPCCCHTPSQCWQINHSSQIFGHYRMHRKFCHCQKQILFMVCWEKGCKEMHHWACQYLLAFPLLLTTSLRHLGTQSFF